MWSLKIKEINVFNKIITELTRHCVFVCHFWEEHELWRRVAGGFRLACEPGNLHLLDPAERGTWLTTTGGEGDVNDPVCGFIVAVLRFVHRRVPPYAVSSLGIFTGSCDGEPAQDRSRTDGDCGALIGRDEPVRRPRFSPTRGGRERRGQPVSLVPLRLLVGVCVCRYLRPGARTSH